MSVLGMQQVVDEALFEMCGSDEAKVSLREDIETAMELRMRAKGANKIHQQWSKHTLTLEDGEQVQVRVLEMEGEVDGSEG